MRPATWLQIVIAYEKGDGNTCMQVLKRLGLSTGILYENNLEAIRLSSILDGSSFVVISVKSQASPA
jgi:hypothetical protein